VLPFQAVVYSITFSSSGGDLKIFQLISFMCVVILQVINFFRWCVCGDSASDFFFQVVIQLIVGGVISRNFQVVTNIFRWCVI